LALACYPALAASLTLAAGPGESRYDAVAAVRRALAELQVRPDDWPQWCGTGLKNNVSPATGIPTDWDVQSGRNIKWVAKLGSQTYGNPVVANGKVYISTNNGAAYLKRYTEEVDLGVMLCFDERTGRFLWQYSSPKLPEGPALDWPLVGICSAPYAEGDRLWFVSNRGEVVCLDAEGFRDGENDGPFKAEERQAADEADVVWKFNMMRQLGTRQHNMSSCSITCRGRLLFVGTSNGVDDSHLKIPAPQAPSFICLDRRTGRLLWADSSPDGNILHGQWSSPACAMLAGVPQVLFPGGDGWLYSFAADAGHGGRPRLLWKFDCNPKQSRWRIGGMGDRNNLIATPAIYDGRVYIAVGQDPEQGEGKGHLWCIDPSRRGDVSPELAVDAAGKPLPPRRVQAVVPERGERAVPNPNSAMLWHYTGADLNGNGKLEFEEEFHRTISTAAIKNDLLIIPDITGVVHCLDARTGKPYWTHDLMAAVWGTPLIVEDKVYIGDEDGKLTIFRLARKKEVINELDMGDSVYSTPIVAGGVLYIATRTRLYAIAQGAKTKIEPER